MAYLDYIDESDQQAFLDDDDEAWLRSRRVKPWSGADGEEEDKACIDTLMQPAEFKFCRVYAVHEHAKVPVDRSTVNKGSPSEVFVKNPHVLRQAVKSAVRLCISFNLPGNSTYASGFFISPTHVLTAGHVVRNRVEKGGIRDVLIHKGILALPSSFQTDACKGQILQRHHLFSKPNPKASLYLEGADIAFIRSSERSSKFLLPCSSTFLQSKDVAVFSFPAAMEYLQGAEYELRSPGEGVIWKAHQPVMQQKLAEIAQSMGIDEKDGRVLESVKLVLLDMLTETFGSFTTGQLLCSVGVLVADNQCSLATSCSTLPGSSGGPICPIERADNFIAPHIGGFPRSSLNYATSCDNATFISFYLANVLPELPKVDDIQGSGVEGFLHWLKMHSPAFHPASLQPVQNSRQGTRHRKKRWPPLLCCCT